VAGGESLAERVARRVVVEGRGDLHRVEPPDERRERGDEVRGDRERRDERDGEPAAAGGGADEQGERTVGEREQDGARGGGGEVRDGDVHRDGARPDPQGDEQDRAEPADLEHERCELLEREPAARDRAREQQLERPGLLLARHSAGAGADGGHQQQQRHHEGEELAAEVAGGGGVVELAAEADERLQRLRILVEEPVQRGVVAHGRVDGDQHRHHPGEAETPPDEAAPQVAQRLQGDVTQHRPAPGRGRGRRPRGRPRGCRAPAPRGGRAP
jgi:hypothetical protein